LTPLRALAAGLSVWRGATASISGEFAATVCACLAAASALESTSTLLMHAVLWAPMGAVAVQPGGSVLAVCFEAAMLLLAVGQIWASLKLLGHGNASGPMHALRAMWLGLAAPGGLEAMTAAAPASDGLVWRNGLLELPEMSCPARCCGTGGRHQHQAVTGSAAEEREGLVGGGGGAVRGATSGAVRGATAFTGRGLSLSGRHQPSDPAQSV
jgi:hypothetical protein